MKDINEIKDKLNELISSDKVYFVKNKDEVIGSFKWVEEYDEYVAKLIEDIRLPRWVSSNFSAWVESRTIAKHRGNIKEYLDSIGLSDTKSLIDVTHALSLNDSLWVCENNSELVWSKINLYKNDFKEVIAKTAFHSGLRGHRFSTTIPEIATGGMQEKCWVKVDGIVYLYKEGSEGFANAGLEPYSEVMVTQILNRLKYNHIDYRLVKYHKSLVSACKLFTSEDVGFISFAEMCGVKDFQSIRSELDKLGFLREFCQMMILDYIVLNTDRHLNNFGFLIDNNTYEIVGFAPLFDHGYSLLNFYMVQDDLETYIKDKYPRITDRTFEDVAKQCKKLLGNEHNVEKLIGFKFDSDELTGLSDSRIDLVQNFVTKRINSFLSW